MSGSEQNGENLMIVSLKIDFEQFGTHLKYRIRVIAAPLLNRAPGNVKSPVFGVFLE